MPLSNSTIIAGIMLAAAIGTAAYLAVTQDNASTNSATPAASKSGGSAPPVQTAQAVPAASPPAASPADAGKAPAEASRPESWIGLPVIGSDGSTVGQVTDMRPGADSKSTVLLVQGSDGKTYKVPGSIAAMSGRAVQVAATAAELGKMAQ
jgi:hypothetical protein